MANAVHDYFKNLTISDIAFPVAPQAIFNIKNQVSFCLLNTGLVTIEYSFDGVTLHGDLVPSTPSAGIFFDNRRVSVVWFRAASSSTVRVEAWAGV